jgi:hypothetical protein
MKAILKLTILVLLLTSAGFVNAQVYLGLFNSSFSSNPSGPAYTAGPAAIVRSSDLTTPQSGALSVSAAFSEQQYGSLPNGLTGFGDLGLMFGIGNNNSGKMPTPFNVGVPLANVGSPLNSYYSPTQTSIGTGMNVFTNNAFNLFACAEGLAGQPTDGRYYFGKVTFTFSRPVANPFLHVTGLGGFLSINEPPFPTLPFAVELELVDPSLILDKFSGTSRTQLNTTTKTIYSSYDYLNDYVLGNKTPEGGDYAATGSFRVTGVNITSVTFKVYLKGMVKNQVWTSNGTFANQVYNGDRFNISWTLPEQPQSPLPVTGVNLKASLNGNDVVLNWKTSTEYNSKQFEIERSTDAKNFKLINTKAAAGSSTSELAYSITDPNMTAKVYFYRLRLVDVDGKFTYSNVAVVRQTDNKGIRSFPNPVASQLNIEFANAKGAYIISMFNQAGQEVQSTKANIENSVQYITLQRNHLISGTYFVRITNIATAEVHTEKIILQ